MILAAFKKRLVEKALAGEPALGKDVSVVLFDALRAMIRGEGTVSSRIILQTPFHLEA